MVASLISAPVAITAAAAAFAAGRIQGRGAYRGPVDAVRRQHQRDAYAVLLNALRTYAKSTSYVEVMKRLDVEYTPDRTPAQTLARQYQLTAEAQTDEIDAALSVVELEGPEAVAATAWEAAQAAGTLRLKAQRAEVVTLLGPSPEVVPLDPDMVPRAWKSLDAVKGHMSG